jgi:putative methyltransferase (TIGR04325 family)
MDALGKLKIFVRLFIPPIFLKLFYLCRSKGTAIQFHKTSLQWDAVLKKTSGYSSENILVKCRDSLLKVKNDEYPYERDSVLFNEIEYFFPLLSSLFYISSKNNNTLNLVDFGGSLGSTYFQNKDILKQAGIIINWNIIEQNNFVECGKKHFADSELHFYNCFDEISRCSAVLLSSVLQYLKEPYVLLQEICDRAFEYLIIDRTVFLKDKEDDLLAIQKVPEKIYDVSYPVWFLSLNKFTEYIKQHYEIIFEWPALDQHTLRGCEAVGLGFLLKKI